MKIVLDLRCCQVADRPDIVAFAESVVRGGSAHQILFLLDRRHLADSDELLRRIERFAALADVILADGPQAGEASARIAAILRNDRVETVSPDVYHLAGPVSGDSGPLPNPPLLRSATLGEGTADPLSCLVSQLDIVLTTTEQAAEQVRRLHAGAEVLLADAADRDGTARALLAAWEGALARRRADAAARFAAGRPRIAMFTPLPPARTGIADYAFEFLDVLRQRAEIEVFVRDHADEAVAPDGVRVWPHGAFPERAETFDAVVYQLGNSPFHHYMLPYVARHPGVVVIHDAYLGHLSHDPGDPAAFVRQAVRDHGGEARAILESAGSLGEGALALIERLTCAATHVHRSLGVIVHSSFARDLLAASARTSVAPSVRVVPQYRAPFAQGGWMGRSEARRRLGLPDDTLLIGTFGHVAETKGPLELIAAFDRAKAGLGQEGRLVFVGELEGGAAPTPYARDVRRVIGERRDIVVTGFVDGETYDLHLQAVDIAVQLRTLTRGETSSAQLNVLWSGTPLIYNRLGSTSELPAEAALALPNWEPEQVAAAIERLAADPDLRTAYGRAGRQHMEATHNGDMVARDFIATVLEMTARARACGPDAVARRLAEELSGLADPARQIAAVAAAYVAQERSEDLPRLLVELTPSAQGDGTAEDLARALYRMADRRFRPQAFAAGPSGLVLADDLARACGALMPVGEPDPSSGALVPRPFDKMLLFPARSVPAGLPAMVAGLNAMGGQVHGFVPDGALRDAADGAWLDFVVRHAEGLICSGAADAEALIAQLRSGPARLRPGFRVGHVEAPDRAAALLDVMTGRRDRHAFGDVRVSTVGEP